MPAGAGACTSTATAHVFGPVAEVPESGPTVNAAGGVGIVPVRCDISPPRLAGSPRSRHSPLSGLMRPTRPRVSALGASLLRVKW